MNTQNSMSLRIKKRIHSVFGATVLVQLGLGDNTTGWCNGKLRTGAPFKEKITHRSNPGKAWWATGYRIHSLPLLVFFPHFVCLSSIWSKRTASLLRLAFGGTRRCQNQVHQSFDTSHVGVNARGVRLWLRWSMATSQPTVTHPPRLLLQRQPSAHKTHSQMISKDSQTFERKRTRRKEGRSVCVYGKGRGEMKSLRQCPSSPSGPPLINCPSGSSDSSHFHQDSQDTFLTRQKNDIVHAAYQACPLPFSY